MDWAGVALVAIAGLGVWLSHEPRRDAARWYAEIAAYNRALTAFLLENRDTLRDRTVAVFGVAGLSPWSNSAGTYLAKLLGSQTRWQVYVPREDIFYQFGRLNRGQVDVQPESGACGTSSNGDIVHLTFDSVGRGTLAQGCEAALKLAHPPPAVEAWGPKTVSSAEAAAGFNMYFIGTNLGPGVEVAVNGTPLAMARAKQGRLMTTSIPAQAGSQRAIPFSVDDRGVSVFRGEVTVAR